MNEIATSPIDIVIPVHNSPDDVRRCIASCVASLRTGDRVVIVDDGSSAETEDICRNAADKNPESVLLIRRPEGTGFCRAANAGLRKTYASIIVLLNSDTVVPETWLDRIADCFATSKDIGIVGPLSNAGGWQSIPGFGPGGPPNNRIVKDDVALAEIQVFCEAFRDRYEYPVVEQVNGFCLAIRRSVLDHIGFLNEELFPMGYGEEVDFNFRSQNAGFLSAIAIDCFVYHDKTKSYSSEKRAELIKRGRAHIDRLHGVARVKDAVTGTRENPILRAIRADAARTFEEQGWLLKEEN